MPDTNPVHDIPGFWAIIPAGGAGTRLWPLSRRDRPKFLRDLTGAGASLLQQTVSRLEPFVADRMIVVTGASHAAAVREQIGDVRLLAEPTPRDSMAAIGLAAAVIEAEDPDAIVGSFAADHVIAESDSAAYAACVGEAVEVARGGRIVTIGITPSHPATGFGYIQVGAPIAGVPTARRVRQFVEKPDMDRAAAYLATGEFQWNAGMFVVRAGTLMDLLARWHPQLADGLREIAARPEQLERIWPDLTSIAIDNAVAEPAADIGLVAVVPGNFGWDDVGDFDSLAALLPDAANGVSVLGDHEQVIAIDSSGLVVPQGDRPVAVVGLDDVVVVDTGDAVLVTSRKQAQDVKQIVRSLRDGGRADLT